MAHLMLSINRSKTHKKTHKMNTQKAVIELVKILSQAIDMIRDHNKNSTREIEAWWLPEGQDNVDYLDKEMQTILDSIKK